jgi:hypothetical protein
MGAPNFFQNKKINIEQYFYEVLVHLSNFLEFYAF